MRDFQDTFRLQCRNCECLKFDPDESGRVCTNEGCSHRASRHYIKPEGRASALGHRVELSKVDKLVFIHPFTVRDLTNWCPFTTLYITAVSAGNDFVIRALGH